MGTGASRESMLAGGKCTDVVTAPGRRVTWETLNLISVCSCFFTSLSFPSILFCSSASQTHMHDLSLTRTQARVNTHRCRHKNTPNYAVLFLYCYHHSIWSSISCTFMLSLSALCQISLHFCISPCDYFLRKEKLNITASPVSIFYK